MKSSRRSSLAWWRAILVVQAIIAAGPHVLRAEDIVGFTEPFQTVEVAAAEGGLIASIDVREGMLVTRGQLLGSLRHEVLLESLKLAKHGVEARGAFNAAVAEERLHRTVLEKIRNLHSRGAASPEEVERATAELEIAEAHLLAANEAREMRRLEQQRVEAELERRMIRSPIEGVVVHVNKQPGEYTSPTNPEILTVVQLDPLIATFSVDSDQTRRLTAAQKVRVVFGEATAVDGSVEFVSPVVEAESGTVRIKIRIPNPEGKLRSGERCVLKP